MGGLRSPRRPGAARRGAGRRGTGRSSRGTGRPPRGTGRPPRGTGGYILLDVIVAMAVALFGLAVFMGSLSTLGRIALRQGARVHTIVEQRNTDAQSRAVVFQGR